MLNLFKKKEQPKQVAAATESKVNYPEIVHQIHGEFLSAGDKTLAEAKALLENIGSKCIEKGERLKALGFKSVPEVAAANGAIKTAELAARVEYYQMNYPNNKFITKEQVGNICEKYDLILGGIEMYKGFVPESKISLMENFKLKGGDGVLVYRFGRSNKTLDEWLESNSEDFVVNNVVFGNHAVAEQRPFLICAPLKDMNIPKHMEVKNRKIVNIPDPIVLQPVEEGYLIICAWGDEASDELVINEKQN